MRESVHATGRQIADKGHRSENAQRRSIGTRGPTFADPWGFSSRSSISWFPGNRISASALSAEPNTSRFCGSRASSPAVRGALAGHSSYARGFRSLSPLSTARRTFVPQTPCRFSKAAIGDLNEASVRAMLPDAFIGSLPNPLRTS
jgi:hypothetical protein